MTTGTFDWSPCQECGHQMSIDMGVLESSGGECVLVYCPSCGGEPITRPDAELVAVVHASPPCAPMSYSNDADQVIGSLRFWCIVAGLMLVSVSFGLSVLGAA